MNSQGISSKERDIIANYIPEVSDKGDLYVISIGVSEYKDETMNLKYADKDAKDILEYFSSNYNEYDEIYEFPFINMSATKKDILELRDVLEKTDVDDTVVLFAAGHGLRTNDLDYYLATNDVDFSNPKELGLNYDDLIGLIDGIGARNRLVLIDACYSGEIDKYEVIMGSTSSSVVEQGKITFRSFAGLVPVSQSEYVNTFELMRKVFVDTRANIGANIITSSSGFEVAIESPEWSNGVFTYSILKGLRSMSADYDNNGEIRISELQNYVINAVNELTSGTQNPTTRKMNRENDFVISEKN